MANQGSRTPLSPYSTLQRFARGARQTPTTRTDPWEHCELCDEPIPPEHWHLVDIAQQQIVCICQACKILFSRPEASQGHYVLVPERVLLLEDFHLDDPLWERLRLPVALAFIFQSTHTGTCVACYPSPLGPTEAHLELDTWADLVRANPVLANMCPDVEALLINRARGPRAYYLVPIDECYSLVGVIRSSWHGLSGGEEVWDAITRYFDALRERAVVVRSEREVL